MEFYRIHSRNNIERGFYTCFYDARNQELAEKFGFDHIYDLTDEFQRSGKHPVPDFSDDLAQARYEVYGRLISFEYFFYGFNSIEQAKKWFDHSYFVALCKELDLVFSYMEVTGIFDENQTLVHIDDMREVVKRGEFITVEVSEIF